MTFVCAKADEVKASHKVQSIRAVVEQVFCDLKLEKWLDLSRLWEVDQLEKVLDAAFALHNLRMLCKLVENFKLEQRNWPIPGEHIFHPKQPALEVNWGIPKNLADLKLPELSHIAEFLDFLHSTPKALAKELGQTEEGSIFYPNVRVRGTNLYLGAYVLQLQVQNMGLDVFRVKYIVGASYSYLTHVGYFEMTKYEASARNICDCFSGFVCSFFSSIFPCLFLLFLFVLMFFFFFLQVSAVFTSLCCSSAFERLNHKEG